MAFDEAGGTSNSIAGLKRCCCLRLEQSKKWKIQLKLPIFPNKNYQIEKTISTFQGGSVQQSGHSWAAKSTKPNRFEVLFTNFRDQYKHIWKNFILQITFVRSRRRLLKEM